MSSVFAYLHPVMATVALLLAWVVFRLGFHQRTLRLRRTPAPEGSYARHVRLGPWSSGLLIASCFGGLGSAVLLRGRKPLDTFHGKLGVASALMFAALWWLGRPLARGDKTHAGRHGVLGVFSLFAAGLAGLLGISLLP